MTALLLPLMLAFGGVAIDYGRWHEQGADMKNLSETLATRGAREFLLANASATQVEAIITDAVNKGIGADLGLTTADMNVAVNKEVMEVSVTFTKAPRKALLLTKFPPYNQDIVKRSTAVARGGMNVCVVSLEETADYAVRASFSAKMTAENCTILANSTGALAVSASGTSKFSAGMICSGGGYSGTITNFDPLPLTDCPEYPDPLAERQPPVITAPVFVDTALGDNSMDLLSAGYADGTLSLTTLDSATQTFIPFTLEPGVYEGGLAIGANADVTLQPGIYVIKNGPLAIDHGARLQGENVAFYLDGSDSTFYFGPESRISLSAPKTGPLAGILFFEDRTSPLDRVHHILSDDARVLLGTFYLPRGILAIASATPVADQSAYTAIVANEIRMTGSPTLVLNSDYGLTDIPVPAGVGPVGGETFLRE